MELGEGVISGSEGAVLHGRTVVAYIVDDGPVNLGAILVRKGHGGIPEIGVVGRDGIGHIGADVHILGQASPEAGEVHALPLLQSVGIHTLGFAESLVGIVGTSCSPVVVGLEIQVLISVLHQVVIAVHANYIFRQHGHEGSNGLSLVGIVLHLGPDIVRQHNADGGGHRQGVHLGGTLQVLRNFVHNIRVFLGGLFNIPEAVKAAVVHLEDGAAEGIGAGLAGKGGVAGGDFRSRVCGLGSLLRRLGSLLRGLGGFRGLGSQRLCAINHRLGLLVVRADAQDNGGTLLPDNCIVNLWHFLRDIALELAPQLLNMGLYAVHGSLHLGFLRDGNKGDLVGIVAAAGIHLHRGPFRQIRKIHGAAVSHVLELCVILQLGQQSLKSRLGIRGLLGIVLVAAGSQSQYGRQHQQQGNGALNVFHAIHFFLFLISVTSHGENL